MPWRSTKIKELRGLEKHEKDQKMMSRLPQFEDLFQDSINFTIYFEGMQSF